MTVQIRKASEPFRIVGDGVATEVRLSVNDYPFTGAPKLSPTSAEIIDDGGSGLAVSVTIENSEAVITLDHALKGISSGTIQLAMFYNLP